MKEDFICALSGVTPTDEETDSTLGDLPEGWIEITIKRVFPNQRYFILQQLKNQAINLTLAQIPEEQREEAMESVRVQVDAQYYSFESSMKDYEEESDTIYISPPENDPAILQEYQKLAKMLGFDTLLYESEENDLVESDDEPDVDQDVNEPVAAENEK